MELENRYIVLKLKDVKELPAYLLNQLDDVCTAVTAIREQRDSKPLECLVIEKHWPEYAPALEMLSARVDGEMFVDGIPQRQPLPNCRSQLHGGGSNNPKGPCTCAAKIQLSGTYGRFGPESEMYSPGEPVVKHSHYFKDVSHLDTIDVYRVLDLYKVTDPCISHAVKKLLVAGGRGAGKDANKDIQEAIDTLERWKAMQAENGVGCVSITSDMVRKLRDETDAPSVECKKALTQACGDMSAAKELILTRAVKP